MVCRRMLYNNKNVVYNGGKEGVLHGKGVYGVQKVTNNRLVLVVMKAGFV